MLIKKEFANKKQQEKKRIVDIGTGSGCIAISLAFEIQHAEVFATDVSEAALSVARKNATELKANVNFIRHDILQDEFSISDIDVVVSNPPYIALVEKSSMTKNVTDFEPHLALFVSDDDPLLFYKVIAEKASAALAKHGALYTEINERFGKEVANVFADRGYHDIQIIKDLSGKERIVKGVKV